MADDPDPFSKNPAGAVTDDQAATLHGWLRAAADQLALRDWRIRVSTHEAQHDSIASSFIADHSDDTVIAVQRGFFELPERARRHALTHELLHPHFQRITRMAEKLLESELGNRTEAVITAAVSEVEELTIDRLAWAISEWLPEAPSA